MQDSIDEYFRKKTWKREPHGIASFPIGNIRDIYRSLYIFFRKKSWYCGGPVPGEILYTKEHFRLLDRIDLVSAIDIGYLSIMKTGKLAKTLFSEHIDTKLCLKVTRECEREKILQVHIGGLFLLYLKLCEKVELL